jgi:hypothetical protein
MTHAGSSRIMVQKNISGKYKDNYIIGFRKKKARSKNIETIKSYTHFPEGQFPAIFLSCVDN